MARRTVEVETTAQACLDFLNAAGKVRMGLEEGLIISLQRP
jgi:hypothetical protein